MPQKPITKRDLERAQRRMKHIAHSRTPSRIVGEQVVETFVPVFPLRLRGKHHDLR